MNAPLLEKNALIVIDGDQTTVMSDADDTVLGALLRAGCGIPYECSAGGCGSCKFTLLSGSVTEDIENPPGLRQSERSKGKRLACVSRPVAECRIAVRLDATYEPVIRPKRVSARYVSCRAITHNMTEFLFRSDGEAQFLPGQYAKLFLPGVPGPRNYSMCNTANPDGHWKFQVKRVPGGIASEVLFGDLTPGVEVEIDAPYSVAHLPRQLSRPVICIAGGSGLAPMLSILHGLAANPAQARAPLLYYGARTQADVVDAEYFRDIHGFDPDRQYVPVVSEPSTDLPWSGGTGLLHEYLASHLPMDVGDYEYFIAGPPPMVDAVRRLLILERKVPIERLHYDRFY